MLIAALGCNLAWGIIDGGVYLITPINMESRKHRWQRVRLKSA